MFFLHAAVTAAMVAAVYAHPTTSSHPTSTTLPTPSGTSFLDTFDDLNNMQTLPAAFSSDGGLTYNTFFFNSDDTSVSDIGVASHSYPNRALYGGLSDPRPGSVATDQACTQLKSYWFGCVLSAGDPRAALPVTCTVKLEGFDKAGSSTGTQSFTFKPDSATTSNMNKATITTIGKSKVIRFSTFAAGGTVESSSTIVTLLDDVSYVQYSNANDCGVGSW